MALLALWVAAGLFFSLAAALEFFALDLWLQDGFFDPVSPGAWMEINPKTQAPSDTAA